MVATTDILKFGTRLSDIKKEDKKYFRLGYDGDEADVIFLYRTQDDVVSFVVHDVCDESTGGKLKRFLCKGKGCSCCKKNMKPKVAIFVPVYNIKEDAVQFWERSGRFMNELDRLFSDHGFIGAFVYRITREGAPGSLLTRYNIREIARNSREFYYSRILDRFNIKFPECYSTLFDEGVDFTEEPEPTPIEETSLYTALICKGCGAPLDARNKCCNFCGTSYIWHEPSSSVMPKVSIGW